MPPRTAKPPPCRVHKIREETHPDGTPICGGAVCVVCKKSFSDWYCPRSPDHTCHYESIGVGPEGDQEFYVRSRKQKGVRYWLPFYYAQAVQDGMIVENEDECIYCGRPEERK